MCSRARTRIIETDIIDSGLSDPGGPLQPAPGHRQEPQKTQQTRTKLKKTQPCKLVQSNVANLKFSISIIRNEKPNVTRRMRFRPIARATNHFKRRYLRSNKKLRKSVAPQIGRGLPCGPPTGRGETPVPSPLFCNAGGSLGCGGLGKGVGAELGELGVAP